MSDFQGRTLQAPTAPKTVRLRQVAGAMVTTIPQDILRGLGWVEGDIIELQMSERGISGTRVMRSEEE